MIKETLKLIKLGKTISTLRRSSDELVKEKSLLYIRDLFESEQGLFFKVLQYMGTSGEQVEEIKKCSTGTRTLVHSEDVKAIFKENFGEHWSEVFLEIDEIGVSASIGQVNKATLRDGSPVVYKFLLPGIKRSVEKQLKLLKLIPSVQGISPLKKWGFDFSDYQSHFDRLFKEELSYKNEINNLLKFNENRFDSDQLVVPIVNENYVSDEGYIASYIEGDSIDEKNKWPLKNCHKYGEILLKNYFHHLLIHGFVQGDTHHGNFIFVDAQGNSPKLGWIDFGNTLQIGVTTRLSLGKLVLSTIEDQDVDLVGLFENLGFDPEKLAHIHRKIPLLCKILFKPFLNRFVFELHSWKLEEEFNSLLGDDKWWFRSAGNAEFFLLIKSLIGIKRLMERLDAQVSWQNLFYQVVAPIENDMRSLIVPESTQPISIKSLAKNLNVVVTEDNKEKVNMKLPATAIYELEKMMSTEMLRFCTKNNIVVDNIVKRAISEGLNPQILFSLEEGKKTYLVQLI